MAQAGEETKDFRRFVFELAEQISVDELESIKFLCMNETIPRAQLEMLHSGTDLLEMLICRDIMNKRDLTFLYSLLVEIDSIVLCQRIESFAATASSNTTFRSDRSLLDEVRILMLHTALELCDNDIKNALFLLEVPRASQDRIKSGIDLFIFLMDQKCISTVEHLKEILTELKLMHLYERMLSKRSEIRPQLSLNLMNYSSHTYSGNSKGDFSDVVPDSESERALICSGKFGKLYRGN